MKDFFDSIKENILQRFSNPLFGAFVVAWLVFNHEYLFILFSDVEISQRLDLAKARVFPDINAILFRGFLFPGYSAVIFVIFHPLVSRLALEWTLGQDRVTKEMQDDLMERVRLTVEDAERLRDEAKIEAKELREERDEAIAMMRGLRAENQAVTSENEALKKAQREASRETFVSKNPGPEEVNAPPDPEVEIMRKARLKGIEDEARAVLGDRAILRVVEYLIAANLASLSSLLRQLTPKSTRDQNYAMHLVDEAERLGLISNEQGEPDPADRRIRLMPKGRTIASLFGL